MSEPADFCLYSAFILTQSNMQHSTAMRSRTCTPRINCQFLTSWCAFYTCTPNIYETEQPFRHTPTSKNHTACTWPQTFSHFEANSLGTGSIPFFYCGKTRPLTRSISNMEEVIEHHVSLLTGEGMTALCVHSWCFY